MTLLQFPAPISWRQKQWTQASPRHSLPVYTQSMHYSSALWRWQVLGAEPTLQASDAVCGVAHFSETYGMPYRHTQTSSTWHQRSIHHLLLQQQTVTFCNGSLEWRCWWSCEIWHPCHDHGWRTWYHTHQTHEQQVWRHKPTSVCKSLMWMTLPSCWFRFGWHTKYTSCWFCLQWYNNNASMSVSSASTATWACSLTVDCRASWTISVSASPSACTTAMPTLLKCAVRTCMKPFLFTVLARNGSCCPTCFVL